MASAANQPLKLQTVLHDSAGASGARFFLSPRQAMLFVTDIATIHAVTPVTFENPMKKITLFIALALLCASNGFAAKIYKWTDSNGNVHYGERPPSEQARELNLPNVHPSDSDTPASTPQDVNKLLDTLQKERDEKAKKAAIAEEERRAREQNCKAAKRNATGYEIGGRIYEIDENGERRYLGDAEIEQKLQESRKAVEKWCK